MEIILQGTGVHRIVVRAMNFATGKTITADFYSPSLVKTSGISFVAVNSSGYYYNDLNFPALGLYFAKVYENGVARASAFIRVVDIPTQAQAQAACDSAITANAEIKRILGLIHENCFYDNPTYDTYGNLSSVRIRLYDTKVNAQAHGATGLLATYTMNSVYSGVQLVSYLMVKE